MTPWPALLEGTLRQRALALVEAERAATRLAPAGSPAFVSSGTAGLALLHGYWFLQHGDDDSAADAAFELAEQAIEHGGSLPLELYAGVVGVGWVAHHLAGRVWPANESGDDDPLASLDEAVLAAVSDGPWTGSFDLLQGLVGLGVFALSRSRPDGDGAARLVAVLAELAETIDGGMAWRTRPEHIGADVARRYPQGTWNLGAAHGLPGVIWFLAQCARGTALRPRVVPLLTRAVDWLLAQELEVSAGNGFPGYLGAGSAAAEPPKPWFRPSWCYADVGLVLPLLSAAAVLESDRVTAAAQRIARRVGGFRHDGSWELDPSLCHGSSGLALICRRLWQVTGDELFAESARYWATRTVEIMEQGFPGLTHGVLMGSTGAALGLLALCGTVPPAWDALMLMSDVVLPAEAPR